MIEYTVYDTATNQIIRRGSALTEETAMLQGSRPGTSVVLVGSDPTKQVINPLPEGPVVVNRVAMNRNGTPTSVNKTSITANGVDAALISNIPTGALGEVFLPANMGLQQPADIIINDGVLYVTTTVAGVYSVRISFQSFLDFTVTINAV